MKIRISDDLCNYIESLQYEVNARKDLCAFMIDHGMMESESFRKYHDEYIKCNAEYNVAKNTLTKEYGIKGSWNLDFDTRELTYEE